MLPAELGRVADRITVILPWGNLLRTLATPDTNSLRDIASLCLADATIEIVFSYDSRSDARDRGSLRGTRLDEQHVLATLPPIYHQAGLRVEMAEKIPQRELAAYETTWAKRLAFGRPREVWRIRARFSPPLE